TEVGYQPTGMNPSERLLPDSETSNTASALMFALATNRIFSSGERARLLGVDPGGDWGSSSATSVSIGFPVSVSSTVTVLRLALATKRCLPAALSNISLGCSSVAQRAVTLFVLRSMTAAAACAQRLT